MLLIYLFIIHYINMIEYGKITTVTVNTKGTALNIFNEKEHGV